MSTKSLSSDIPQIARPVRSGGQILAAALRVHGVDRVFCVPGESFLDVLDGLYDMPDIQVVVAKHEGAAANMAEADGKLTGRPGVCFVTRGPGATQACVGVHTAFQDSTPMILFIGQVERPFRGREAFQEIEFRQMFAPLAKWVAEIEDPGMIPEYLLRAFECATSGRPGPVVLSLPEDMLMENCSVAETSPFTPVQAQPSAGDTEAFRRELSRSSRPIMIVGGSGWSEEACAALRVFAETYHMPILASFRRQDLLDNEHRCYAGHLGLTIPSTLAERIQKADLIIALGTRLGEMTTGAYTRIEPNRPLQRLVHIHADQRELGRVFKPDLAIHAGSARFALAMKSWQPPQVLPWTSWTEAAHSEYLQFADNDSKGSGEGVNLATVVKHVSSRLPTDSIITNGAGNYTAWVNRYMKYRQFRTELAPISGAMGYGFPAAIAAKLRHPGRTAICFAGDGCFLMYAQELATAMQYGAAVITIVVNNGMYGTIRMFQERRFPDRVIASQLYDPDFVALAKSFGAYAERVERTESFADAFERALESRTTALLDVCVDNRQITPDSRLHGSEVE